jgi:hypothetical protein
MVQVDVFWSYGLSAGLALAGQKRIRQARSWWDNEAFLFNVLWTACVFGPSGIYLLWTNPAWETMFVARDFSSLPAWLVAIFTLTNITQGVLGFFVTATLLRANKTKAAIWQTVGSHLIVLAILIFGWDGSGYKRFFYAGSGADWVNQKSYALADFFSCPVFYALLILTVLFVPTYLGLIQVLRRPRSA